MLGSCRTGGRRFAGIDSKLHIRAIIADAKKGSLISRSSGARVGLSSSWTMYALAASAITIAVTVAISAFGVPRRILDILPASIAGSLADRDKAWLALVWICTGASIIVIILLDRARALQKPRRIRTVAMGLALVGFILTLVMSVWQNAPFEIYPNLWVGFPKRYVLVGILLAAIIFWSARFVWTGRRPLLLISILFVSVVAIGPLIQTPYSFEIGYDNSFTLDEILAPAAGRVPGFDYVNQYESLLGFPLAAIALLFPAAFAASPEFFAIGWIVLLQVGTIAGAVAVVIRVFPVRLRWVVPLLIVPVAFLVGTEGLPYYADLPMRFVLPIVLLALLVYSGMRQVNRAARWWNLPLIGLVGGMAAFNNLDFGVPALLAGFVAITLSVTRWRTAIKNGLLYFAGALLFPLLYIAAGVLSGRTYHPEYTFFFVLNFGVNGHMNVDMPTFGLHIGFVILGVIGIVVGALGSRALRNRALVLHRALLYQSAWLLLSLVYFSGRSLTPTLVTGSALLAGVTFALLLGAGYPFLRLLFRQGVRRWSVTDWLTAILVLLSLALPLAAWFSFPALDRPAARLLRAAQLHPNTIDYMRPNPGPALQKLPEHTDLIGVLAVMGNAWSSKLAVTNANLFLHPDYLGFTGGAELECNYLATLPGETLLTTQPLLNVLAADDTCQHLLDVSNGTPIAVAASDGDPPTEWVLVDRR